MYNWISVLPDLRGWLRFLKSSFNKIVSTQWLLGGGFVFNSHTLVSSKCRSCLIIKCNVLKSAHHSSFSFEELFSIYRIKKSMITWSRIPFPVNVSCVNLTKWLCWSDFHDCKLSWQWMSRTFLQGFTRPTKATMPWSRFIYQHWWGLASISQLYNSLMELQTTDPDLN